MALISTFQIPSDIQKQIRLVEERMLFQTHGYHAQLETALHQLLASGGKRMRPLLILLIGKMCAGPEEELINLASSIELLHTATLVHDDLIDGSSIRRGVPTLNSHWSPAPTVLSGDFLFSRAASLAAETNNLEVIKLFSKTLSVIVNGELGQFFDGPYNSSFEDYYQRIYAKTASLFETSTRSAAILSQVSEENVEGLSRFGYSLGVAFQIIDDLLDYIGDATQVGKPVGSDLRQGLITLPMLLFIQSHPEMGFVKNLIAHRSLEDEKEMKEAIQAISNDKSIIQRTLDEAQKFIDQAKETLIPFTESEAKSNLLLIADFTAQRTL
jgi:geranylgeranyl pyrophosphate synthase